ncbi:B12-binding domain-containing radical SAM protein, partial [Candidatus Bathyarchaeota archaeon]|nr:B12-binding domain-containing radical SAM protein [Candidatus Bathyarchaeota archaeon]
MNSSKSKVLLVSPPWYRLFGYSSAHLPLGLCYVAAVLEKQGYDVFVYNADYRPGSQLVSASGMSARYEDYLRTLGDKKHSLWKDIEGVIRSCSPDIVGISVMTAKYGSALNVSRLVKEICPDTPVVWGGVHPTILPDESMRNPDVDFVVRGEGEYTFLNLVENLREPDKVLGITYKHDGKVVHNQDRPLIGDLDELPFPAKHLVMEKENLSPDAFGNIFASRGCPYSCVFCASHKVWGRKVRFRSPGNVIQEIKEVRNAFKTRRFSFEDDTFALDRKRVDDICDLFIKEDLGVKWVVETRANLIKDGLVKKMKHAGCEEITIGVESGDEQTLKRIKKGITVEQVRNANKILKDNKMKLSAFFLIGFPWETRKEIDKTVSLMKEIDPRTAIISVVTPYPGTELYEVCVSEGLMPKNLDW